jgi:methionyl-tRNA formyltransferase
MKIVFMGTPDFAIPSLKKILQSHHTILSVVTAPDKERGRGRKFSFTPIKDFALKEGVEVLTPSNLKDQEFIQHLKELKPDLFIVVAFRILPREVYLIPEKGAFNLHGSLLPKYRGAAPIQWALINGEKETGVTTFFLEDKVDTGNIIIQEKLRIDNDDNFESLHDKMMLLGADVIMETLGLIESDNVRLKKQDDSNACPAPKITKDIYRINWNKPTEELYNLIRGLSPYPAAFFYHNGINYKVFKTRIPEKEKLAGINSQFSIEPSSLNIFHQTKNEIYVKTSDGILQILELQPEGRKRMNAEEFLRGNTLTRF